MFFPGDYRFFVEQRIADLLDPTMKARKNRWYNFQHPKAYKMFVCSPPWKSIPVKMDRCFKAI